MKARPNIAAGVHEYSVDGQEWRDTSAGAWEAWVALEERAVIPASHRCRDAGCAVWH